MELSPTQVAAILNSDPNWRKESPQTRAWMLAIAKYESGFETTADNSQRFPQYRCKGLWQICQHAWPELHRQFNLFDPVQNAAAAYIVYATQEPEKKITRAKWAVYPSPASAYFMQALNTIYAAPDQGGVSFDDFIPGIPDFTPDWVDDISKAVTFFTDPGNWLRLASFVGGGFLITMGAILLVATSKPARRVADLIPVGKAVKGVARVAA